jgi:hypothetical protein
LNTIPLPGPLDFSRGGKIGICQLIPKGSGAKEKEKGNCQKSKVMGTHYGISHKHIKSKSKSADGVTLIGVSNSLWVG